MHPQIDILRISAILTDTDTDTMLRMFYGNALHLDFYYFKLLLSVTVDRMFTSLTGCRLIAKALSTLATIVVEVASKSPVWTGLKSSATDAR